MRFAKPKPAPEFHEYGDPLAPAPTPTPAPEGITPDGGGSRRVSRKRAQAMARHKPGSGYVLHLSDLTSKMGWNDHTYLGLAVRFIDSMNLTEQFKTYMDNIARAEQETDE